jgi:hypothetical protein
MPHPSPDGLKFTACLCLSCSETCCYNYISKSTVIFAYRCPNIEILHGLSTFAKAGTCGELFKFYYTCPFPFLWAQEVQNTGFGGKVVGPTSKNPRTGTQQWMC